MKTIFTLMISLFLFNQVAYSQSVCRSQLLNYNGPHNTADLTTKLYTSTNPIIINLSSSLKQALILRTVFDNGYPLGIDSSDVCLTNFFQSNSAASILSAIFSCPVAIYSFANKPVFSTMSLTNFLNLYNSNPVLYAYTPFISACYNCYFGKKDVCCYVGGNGCYDIAIEFTHTGERFYVVQQ